MGGWRLCGTRNSSRRLGRYDSTGSCWLREDANIFVLVQLLSSNANGLEHLTKEVKEIEKAFAQWDEEQKLRPRGGF